MTEANETISSYNSQHNLAVAAMVLLAIFVFVSLPLVGSSLTNIRIFQALQSVSATVQATEPGAEGREAAWILSKGLQAAAAVSQQILRPAWVIGALAAAVCLIWLYRVYQNLPALGARNLKFTTLWAVGWWFIPFAHFVRPYQIMRELWQGSGPSSGDEMMLGIGSPSALLGWWWALVVSTLALRFYYPMWAGVGFARGDILGAGHYLDPEFYYVEVGSAAVSIGAALLGIVVVFSVDRMQSEKQRMIAATAAPPESPQAPPPESPQAPPPESPGASPAETA